VLALVHPSPGMRVVDRWRRVLSVQPPERYARLLYRCGFVDPNVRLMVYPHVLASREAVVERMKGTRRVSRAAAAAARCRGAVFLSVQADTLLGTAVRLKADTTYATARQPDLNT